MAKNHFEGSLQNLGMCFKKENPVSKKGNPAFKKRSPAFKNGNPAFKKGNPAFKWVPPKVNLRRNHFVVAVQGKFPNPNEFYYI